MVAGGRIELPTRGFSNLIRLRHVEVLLDQIRDELSRLAADVSTRSVSRLRSHPIFPHQPSNTMFATAFSSLSEVQEHARRSVNALTVFERCVD